MRLINSKIFHLHFEINKYANFCNCCLDIYKLFGWVDIDNESGNSFPVWNKWSDGLYLYTNQTNSNLNESIYSCVPDCSLAHFDYISNPSTRECVYCGSACQSCSSKYGWELWNGLNQSNSVNFQIYGGTGYATNFSIWYRCYDFSPFWEQCQAGSSLFSINWETCGYGIEDSEWSSWNHTGVCLADCNSGWNACATGYTLLTEEVSPSWSYCGISNCGVWSNNVCTKWTDGYTFSTVSDWQVAWYSETYYDGDWLEWVDNDQDDVSDQCLRCNTNLILKSTIDSNTSAISGSECTTTCDKTQYVDYIYTSGDTGIYDLRQCVDCSIENWYEWAGNSSGLCKSCMSGYYLKLSTNQGSQ